VAALPGVTRAALNFGAATLAVEGSADPRAVIREAARHDGILARPADAPAPASRPWLLDPTRLRLAVSGLAILVAWGLALADAPPLARTLLYAAAILVGGFATIRQGLRALARLQFDMNGMMTGAVGGAACIGEWEEGAVVAFLYALSHWLEGVTMDRARGSIRSVMDLAPREARVVRDGREIVMASGEVRPGDLLLVRPGEKLAADGTVRSGHSAVDQSPITGESLPVEKGPGDPVYAGSLNGQAALEVMVTRKAEETTLARIIHLVEEAQGQRAPSQQFVERFARIYTPLVFGLALTLMLVPPLLLQGPWADWIYRGLALLIVACPCALVVSTPVSIVSAIAAAARHGVLIKGGAYLEEFGRLRAIALDKTGTLTRGLPEVTDVVPLNGATAERLLALAAGVEAHSSHPLARAVVRAAERRGIAAVPARDFAAIPGKGGVATVDGQPVLVGSPRLFDEQGGDGAHAARIRRLEDAGKTVMLVGPAARVLGLLALADPIRPEAAGSLEALRAAGIEHVALLTGDNRASAEAIARQVGADLVRAEVLPEEKLEVVRALMAEFGHLAMVGDGVNDAPALAASSVGVAMGAAGSDVALETADVALMADDLTRLPFLMRLGRRTLRVIRQNIAFALAVKALALAAILPGWLTLWLAVLADMGATVLVTLNGMRLLAERPASHRHPHAP
jgi:Cd2+/Zn2+-exporting ATPase